MSPSRRNVEGDLFELSCITVQGDHDPVWSVALLSPGSSEVVINGTLNDYIKSSTEPGDSSFVNMLIVTVNTETRGRYICRSAVSGVLQTFLLVTGLPHSPAHPLTPLFVSSQRTLTLQCPHLW